MGKRFVSSKSELQVAPKKLSHKLSSPFQPKADMILAGPQARDEFSAEGEAPMGMKADELVGGMMPGSFPTSVHHVFWTGGFDSTAMVLSHLDSGQYVQPIYMRHSPSWNKCKTEERAQEAIRNFLGNPHSLKESIVWDFDQLSQVPGAKSLWGALDELADALEISHQYSALRFCREIMGYTEKIEIGVVVFDELWERMTFAGAGFDSPLRKFFKDFDFPVINKTKRVLWEETTPKDQEALKLTISCEKFNETRGTCRSQKAEFRNQCGPCRRRVEALTG